MAEEVEMTPVEMTPVDAAEPPKVNPLAKAVGDKPATLKMAPIPRTPVAGAGALKPGLKLPPKPGATVSALKPGLKLPPKPGAAGSALMPGIKLPPKPAAAGALKPGLKLPPKPGATVSALKPGLKLPTKPVINKPDASAPSATALPKPLNLKPVAPAATEPAAPVKPVEAPAEPKAAEAPAAPAPAAPAAPVAAPVAAPAAPAPAAPATPAPAAAATAEAPAAPAAPTALSQLKSVTQKLKNITQEIPQQAILRKTGIIDNGTMSEAQKEAAKHKTARISLSDAMGVAPVKNENSPLKTIRIKRPIDIPAPAAAAKPAQDNPAAPAEASADKGETPEANNASTEPKTTVTQRKTLKISRPGGVVRPAGKFGIKKPGQTATAPAGVPKPAAPQNEGSAENAAVSDIPEIADIPSIPPMPEPAQSAADSTPAWAWTLSSLIQFAACVAIAALVCMLYKNVHTMYF